MQLTETASERALAHDVSAFLTREGLVSAELPRGLDDRMSVLRRWQAACYAAGYVGRAWPEEFGGGWSRSSWIRSSPRRVRPSS
jgi:alkylation response protein AidB-like acyl-CoA dehydrogenase